MENTTFNNGQLIKKILIEGRITAKTGLHIGGNSVGMSIGGADATVVRNPITNEPYIPGSSLKGKMRSLLEKVAGKFGPSIGDHIQKGPLTEFVKEGNGISEEEAEKINLIVKIFGTMPEKIRGSEEVPSRLIVRDCELEKSSAEKLSQSKDTDMPYTEVKTEVVIDRITSAATPRQLERVPAGAVFNMRMILNVYDGDNEKEMLNKIFEGLALVQNDYLGGKGTRGSGEVDIKIQKLMYKDKDTYEKAENWKEYGSSVVIPEEIKNH
ncbi:type III-A CRISPR-associated RAMP protein Csm3 [Ignavibacterium sp.]|uniref:type III-A CRISPR-associated RAMP protein Csm3 n=1 Tax=Ignavibacterium sp. TaxID=2651167 RepID=UPI00307F0156